MFTVCSEINNETNYQPVYSENGNIVSKFRFRYPSEYDCESTVIDKEGDFDVRRPRYGTVELEHSGATELKFVGLQVWRGALLLADYLFHMRRELACKSIMELGAGVGLSSIAAAIHNSGRIYCTDVNLGCILQLICGNVRRNASLLCGQVTVMEYNFMTPKSQIGKDLLSAIDESDVIMAADVIYDDELTVAFVGVLEHIFARGKQSGRSKHIYLALEKRFVFTVEEFESVAPMYEHFLKLTAHKPWIMERLPTDFPQYFEYERCPQLVLMRISCH